MSASTLLTGVAPSVRSHIKLNALYNRIRQLLQKLPEDAAYRINTEAIICHRLSVLKEAGDDIKEIEECICGGNIQMLIRQAEAEFGLVQKMISWKPWERLTELPPKGQWDWPPAV